MVASNAFCTNSLPWATTSTLYNLPTYAGAVLAIADGKIENNRINTINKKTIFCDVVIPQSSFT